VLGDRGPFGALERFFLKVHRSNMGDQLRFVDEPDRVLAALPTTEESCDIILRDFQD
jgi:hypothetical protein